ncbi:MAG: hypothetical protein KGD65_00300 [Candidatus Lokiarchaeota archaeon]|nr:hypothetical protein [Candidatus Lokiarchaeota archaeon]
MTIIWDTKADTVEKGDRLRDISPLHNKTNVDNEGFTHYVFDKIMFNNPRYSVPSNDITLFQKFINGGSREYPSDGNIPTDIVAGEARDILKGITDISKDPKAVYHKEAFELLKNSTFDLLRGTVKLYLGKYTTRDWRRKRFTDDIDFWVHEVDLLEHVLRKTGWVKNKVTREWEKKVYWDNPTTNERETLMLIASNDINQALDFGGGSYLEGTTLKDIFRKKIKRGHDVDISDIINVAMIFNKAEGFAVDEWYEAWDAFEEGANTRSTRTISNLITLVRYSHSIADYLERVGNILIKLHDLIFDQTIYPDQKIIKITHVSIHWQKYLKRHGLDITREMIHNYIFEQGYFKRYYSKNLKHFADKVLDLLNSRIKNAKVVFEIEK